MKPFYLSPFYRLYVTYYKLFKNPSFSNNKALQQKAKGLEIFLAPRAGT